MTKNHPACVINDKNFSLAAFSLINVNYVVIAVVRRLYLAFVYGIFTHVVHKPHRRGYTRTWVILYRYIPTRTSS